MTGLGPKGERLFIDSRMGGVRRYYHGPKPKDFEMRVSPDIKNSVCFLCGKKADGSYDASGTGFFVSVPSESQPDVGYLYLITAKHNIDRAKAKGYSTFHLRINTNDGGVDFMEVADEWRYTDDKVADVAVMQIYELDNNFTVATMPHGFSG